MTILKFNFKIVTIVSNKMIDRKLTNTITQAFHYFPVVTIVGPRQSGKTTLCRILYGELPYANLEDNSTLDEAQQDPKAFLNKYEQGMIIDEAQRFPELFSYLQVLVDEDRMNGNGNRKFIVTGSANFALMQQISQSMAGRTAVLTLLPLSTTEQKTYTLSTTTNERIIRGGYPAIWMNDDDGREMLLSNYYTTYIERDLRQLIQIKDLRLFNTFIRLCAGRIGSEFNASSLAVEVGVSVPTIQSWISILQASYIIHLLPPFYANIRKRLVKSPKIYFYDTGMASWLIGIRTTEHLVTHPLRGNLFENMVINDQIKHYTNQGMVPNLYFYRDQQQHEVDLLDIQPDGTIHAYEIKSGQTYCPDYFNNLHYLKKLMPDKVVSTQVIYDGDQENPQPFDGFIRYENR